MITARSKYYYDLTRYNFGFSVITGLVIGTKAGIFTFGTFGMIVGLISYKYFQNNQYYFYYNLGISKLSLISVTWIINLTISAFFLLLLSKWIN